MTHACVIFPNCAAAAAASIFLNRRDRAPTIQIALALSLLFGSTSGSRIYPLAQWSLFAGFLDGWYARNMYMEGSLAYQHHLNH